MLLRGIRYDPSNGVYYDHIGPMTRVTEYVNDVFFEPFNAQVVASNVAAKRGCNVEDVFAEWAEARMRGTAAHKYIERVFREWDSLGATQMYSEPISSDAEEGHRVAFRKWVESNFELLVCNPIMSEVVVGSSRIGLAGTSDLVVVRPDGHQVVDFKTGRFSTHGYGTLIHPKFADVPASKFSRASLQVSLYRILIEEREREPTVQSIIVHLKEDGAFEEFDAWDFRSELREVLLLHL